MSKEAVLQGPRHLLVSVVVAARNEASRIEACLRALLAQDLPRDTFEVVVVDNASTDGTGARAAAHDVRVVREPRVGIAHARNAGVEAARAELIAFVDADSVPDRRWLAELLVGAEDGAVGCWVGEIAPLETRSLIARYVHERGLISQRWLLTRTPQAAATGSIAYRRAVFTTIGGFDPALARGEDSDLFWRMVKSGRFRVRYHPRAVVAHAHPTRVAALARRTYQEGVALGRFRRKHADDLPASYTSLPFAVATLLRTLLGVALYPVRSARCFGRGMAPSAALAYPLLDKMISTMRLAGTVRALATAPPVTQAVDLAPNDALELDLDTAPLLAGDDTAMRARVRRDLAALSRGIVAAFPRSAVVLTGSLSVGEGRVEQTARGAVVASDYDLFVVTPRAWDAVPAVGRRKLEAVLRAVGPLAAAVDIGFVWQPLVRWRKTTLGGAVIAGSRALCPLLVPLSAPSALSALLQAYGYLTAAPLEPARYADLAARALVRAARALLLADAQGRPRREWIGLSSVRVVQREIATWRPVLGGDAVGAMTAACEYLLGERRIGPSAVDHARHCAVLRGASARMRGVESRVVTAKQMLWRLGEARRGHRDRLGGRPVLDAMQTLAESWSSETPLAADYAAGQRLLAAIATFNPHRFVYRPGEARA